MRDDRHLLRWLDLSWFAPMPLSLGLAIWAAMARPTPETLAVLLLVQMALVASACSVPASLAAGRSRVWWRRVAPSTFTQAVHRSWREHTLALLAIGLLGPAVAAARAGGMGDWALAAWALALPLLGAAVGALAGWAWSGALRPAGLALGPAVAGIALAMSLAPAVWLDLAAAAAVALGLALGLLAWAWRTARHMQPRWAGVRPSLLRGRQPAPGLRRWQWDTLAFDDRASNEAHGTSALWSRFLPFLILGFSGAAPLKAVMADDISGITAVHFVIYAGFLLTFAASGLVLRVAHWRLRLAPGSLRPNGQILRMLADTSVAIWSATAGVIGFHAWQQGLAPSALALPLARAALDALLVVGLAAWLRGLDNRSWVAMAWSLGLLALGGALLWWMQAQGVAVARGATFMAAQALLAAVLMALALRAWRGRVPQGLRQWGRAMPAD
jgi:hypothetical protein